MPESVENPYAQPVPTAPPLSPAEEKQWALLTHLISLFAGIIPAIIFWVIYRDRGPFVRAHTTTEFNLQLTVSAVSLVGFVLCFVPLFTTMAMTSTPQSPGPPPALGFFFFGYFLILGVKFVAFIMGIFASVAASKGKYFRYKGIIPFVRA